MQQEKRKHRHRRHHSHNQENIEKKEQNIGNDLEKIESGQKNATKNSVDLNEELPEPVMIESDDENREQAKGQPKTEEFMEEEEEVEKIRRKKVTRKNRHKKKAVVEEEQNDEVPDEDEPPTQVYRKEEPTIVQNDDENGSENEDDDISKNEGIGASQVPKKISTLLFPHPKLIQKELDRRAGKKVMQSITRKRFTKEEDEIIMEHLDAEAPDWKMIAQLVGNGRTPKSCKDRWFDALAPYIDRSPWTQEDKELLVKLVRKYGPKYTLIAKFFKGRTGHQVKNMYITYMKIKEMDPNKELNDIKENLEAFDPTIPVTFDEFNGIRAQLLEELKTEKQKQQND